MPKYVTIKEFAEIAGVEPKTIHKDASPARGKVFKERNDAGKPVIDLENEINQYYLEQKSVKNYDVSQDDKSSAKKSSVKEIKSDTVTRTRSWKPTTLIEADLHKKQLDAEKVELEICLNKLKKERLEGKLLSKDYVLESERIFFEELVTAFRLMNENLIEEISIKYNLDRSTIIEMNKLIVEKCNDALDLSKSNAESRMEKMVIESQNTRYNV